MKSFLTWTIVTLVAIGCAAPGTTVTRRSATAQGAVPIAKPAAEPPSPQSLERLTALHTQREGNASDRDYILGPGDVLAVKAYDFEDINQKVRVDGDGTITLPLLESVKVGGRTVSEVQKDLTARLGEYMYAPHVSLFVEEYRSQQVAVVGAVQRPGLVNQTTRNATVLDALSAAGGMASDAGSRIYLIPAETRAEPETEMLALAAAGGSATLSDAGGSALPIVVDTKEITPQAQRLFYSLPVRGGDVIIVPRNGHFIAEGWVEKPGSYPLQSGLTLRGAIAIAGGLSFPASTGTIRIFRSSSNGDAEMHAVNYDDVLAQRAPDVLLEEGDVIEIQSSTAKLVSWGFYKMVSDLIHVGARVPIP